MDHCCQCWLHIELIVELSLHQLVRRLNPFAFASVRLRFLLLQQYQHLVLLVTRSSNLWGALHQFRHNSNSHPLDDHLCMTSHFVIPKLEYLQLVWKI